MRRIFLFSLGSWVQTEISVPRILQPLKSSGHGKISIYCPFFSGGDVPTELFLCMGAFANMIAAKSAHVNNVEIHSTLQDGQRSEQVRTSALDHRILMRKIHYFDLSSPAVRQVAHLLYDSLLAVQQIRNNSKQVECGLKPAFKR